MDLIVFPSLIRLLYLGLGKYLGYYLGIWVWVFGLVFGGGHPNTNYLGGDPKYSNPIIAGAAPFDAGGAGVCGGWVRALGGMCRM